MSGINNIKSGIKQTFVTFLELLHIRINMATIELNIVKEKLLRIVFCALVTFVLLLLSSISLLFALNAYLPEEQKASVFFIISAVSILIVAILVVFIITQLSQTKVLLPETMDEIKKDIAAVKSRLNNIALDK